MAKLKVNGETVEFDGDASTPLLWVLREQLGLTGTKYGCGKGLCGACTVHIDGKAVRACHPVQLAWAELDVPQCGYCQPGFIMAAAALLERNPAPDDADIDANLPNICRCGTYNRVRRGVHRAVQLKKEAS